MNPRVFIVDDDPSVRESIAKVLNNSGYEAVTAANGTEAITCFNSIRTDLVLLDLNLPQRCGWDVFEHFTRHQPEIPIIIITGMPNQYSMALAAGAGALMEKPVEVPVLLQLIEDLLSEPKEVNLRRMCGLEATTRYVNRIGHSPGRGR